MKGSASRKAQSNSKDQGPGGCASASATAASAAPLKRAPAATATGSAASSSSSSSSSSGDNNNKNAAKKEAAASSSNSSSNSNVPVSTSGTGGESSTTASSRSSAASSDDGDWKSSSSSSSSSSSQQPKEKKPSKEPAKSVSASKGQPRQASSLKRKVVAAGMPAADSKAAATGKDGAWLKKQIPPEKLAWYESEAKRCFQKYSEGQEGEEEATSQGEGPPAGATSMRQHLDQPSSAKKAPAGGSALRKKMAAPLKKKKKKRSAAAEARGSPQKKRKMKADPCDDHSNSDSDSSSSAASSDEELDVGRTSVAASTSPFGNLGSSHSSAAGGVAAVAAARRQLIQEQSFRGGGEGEEEEEEEDAKPPADKKTKKAPPSAASAAEEVPAPHPATSGSGIAAVAPRAGGSSPHDEERDIIINRLLHQQQQQQQQQQSSSQLAAVVLQQALMREGSSLQPLGPSQAGVQDLQRAALLASFSQQQQQQQQQLAAAFDSQLSMPPSLAGLVQTPGLSLADPSALLMLLDRQQSSTGLPSAFHHPSFLLGNPPSLGLPYIAAVQPGLLSQSYPLLAQQQAAMTAAASAGRIGGLLPPQGLGESPSSVEVLLQAELERVRFLQQQQQQQQVLLANRDGTTRPGLAAAAVSSSSPFLSAAPQPAGGSGSAGTGSRKSGSGAASGAGRRHPRHQQYTNLALSSDKEWLSEYQVFLREQVYLFEATEADLAASAQGRNRPIELGQVGVLCKHCSHIPPGQRGRGAVYFPARLSNLYQAVRNMALNHLLEGCSCIPKACRKQLIDLKDKKSNVVARGTKQYWTNTGELLGLTEDGENGLVFKRTPDAEDSSVPHRTSPPSSGIGY